jgi:DNA-directed RNA polymerase subunit RPC12/RpoP
MDSPNETNPRYSCGKCLAEFERRSKNESPRCPNCGYRIIEKLRTNKPVQYLAR